MSKARSEKAEDTNDSSRGGSARPAERKQLTPREKKRRRRRLPLFCLTTLGIVYGDIGTSPLYALRECFQPEDAPGRLAISAANVLGI